MDLLLKKAKELVDENIKEEQEKEITELLYATTAALLLEKPKLTLEKLPSILKELEILASDQSITEMLYKYDKENQLEENLFFCDAAVMRSFVFDSKKNTIAEGKTLLLSYNQETTSVKFLKMTIHEFFHMLRYCKIKQTKEQITIKNGVEYFTFDLDTNTSTRYHRTLEDSIVQKYTNEAANSLEIYLKACENLEQSPLLTRFIKESSACQYTPYALGTFLLEQLCLDPIFKELIEETFEETEIPSQVEQYYNDIISSPNAFDIHSKALDQFQQKFLERKVSDAQRNFKILKSTTLEFLEKTKTKQKRI